MHICNITQDKCKLEYVKSWKCVDNASSIIYEEIVSRNHKYLASCWAQIGK